MKSNDLFIAVCAFVILVFLVGAQAMASGTGSAETRVAGIIDIAPCG